MNSWKILVLVVVGSLATTGCKHPFFDQNMEEQTASPNLIAPLEFEDYSVIGPVSVQGVNHLLNERIKIGSSDDDAYDFLVRYAGQEQKRVHAETVADYLAARKSGAYPYNTFDLAMDSFFQRAASALVFLKQALPARTNYLNKTPLLNLSVSFVYFPERAGIELIKRDVKKGLRLRDYANSRTIWNVRQASPAQLQFTTGEMDYDVELLARGDYDHDGFQDGLLIVAASHNGGSGRIYNAYLVSCKNPAKPTNVKDFEFWQ